MLQLLSTEMSRELKPSCTRDNHVMRYEEKGIQWSDQLGELQVLPSYHCSYLGCSVRYTPAQGYFTVVRVPDEPYFIEEPGTNSLRCPKHGTWLFREQIRHEFIWRCAIENCKFAHSDVPVVWLPE